MTDNVKPATADPHGVLTGVHYMDGDHACCEGALAAGCRFVAGYPITPSTAIIERFARRIPTVGGIFVQMEDEIASSIAIQGAVWTGMKAMTVTSGPGFSLMMEHVGYAAMTETPCVFVNVQRGGPSTGLPTLPGQGDMMQARWGSHGDYKIIALCPSSPQECFDLCIEAFNLSERFRVPVFFMMDECVGHMMERVDIPTPEAVSIYPRRFTKRRPGEYLPYEAGEDLVPEMVRAGEGYKIHVTGLTHDEKGYPAMTPEAQAVLVQRLVEKVHHYNDDITHIEETDLDDADVVILSYGISSRVATRAWRLAREEGIKVGMMSLKVVWPFPQNRVREVADSIHAFIVPEINMGQVSLVVQRYIAGRAEVELVPHTGGGVHDPNDILDAIRRVNP